jgi:hypothetical protein
VILSSFIVMMVSIVIWNVWKLICQLKYIWNAINSPRFFQTMFTFSLYKLVVPFSLNKIFGIQRLLSWFCYTLFENKRRKKISPHLFIAPYTWAYYYFYFMWQYQRHIYNFESITYGYFKDIAIITFSKTYIYEIIFAFWYDCWHRYFISL